MRDFLIGENEYLKILNGNFDTGESEMQEVAFILQSQQGEWKETPLIGANLFQFLKGKTDKTAIEQRVRIQLSLDDKAYNTLKNKIKMQINPC